MNDNDRAKLEIEAGKGNSYARVWESHLVHFFENKQKELFEAFQTLPTTAKKELLTVKLQSNALQSLSDEFQHFITTGKLAQQMLDEEHTNDS